MKSTEKYVSVFKEHAKRILTEQSFQLATYKESYLLGGKLNRIKVFNTHLAVLKDELDYKVRAILETANIESPTNYDELENALKAITTDVVNEFLCISFL